jgi:hypothetical protein
LNNFLREINERFWTGDRVAFNVWAERFGGLSRGEIGGGVAPARDPSKLFGDVEKGSTIEHLSLAETFNMQNCEDLE